LDDLDEEIEKHGELFCRHADNCNIYAASKAAGERELSSIKKYLSTRLRLKVNKAKSRGGGGPGNESSWATV